MKKIKLLSSLLEQDDKFDFSPGALSGGATVQQPKTDNKQKKSDNTKGSGTNDKKADGSAPAKSETEQANSTEPRASLIKLPNCTPHDKDSVKVNSIVWPWAVSWKSTGGEVFNPATKTPVNADKLYYFNTSGEQKVTVYWVKTAEESAPLYSGQYTIGSNKISITGTEGQTEVIDIASGKIESSNVKVVPGSQLELNTEIGRFSRNKPNFSWYFYMKMFNLQTENPELRAAILDALTAAGYKPYNTVSSIIDTQKMVVNTAAIKDRGAKGFSYWPVANLFYSQFAPGKTEVGFGTITDIDAPVRSTAKSGKINFTSGYEYLAYKLEGATRKSGTGSAEHSGNADSDGVNTVFSDDEALGFYSILAGLSSGVVAKLNQVAKAGGYAIPNGSWSDAILDEAGYEMNKNEYYKDIYTKYIANLAANNGASFTQQAIISLEPKIEDTPDAKWFRSAANLYALGGTYLQDALKATPKYVAPKPETHVIK